MIQVLTVFCCLTVMTISFSQESLGKDEVLTLFEEIETSDRNEMKDSVKRGQIFKNN